MTGTVLLGASLASCHKDKDNSSTSNSFTGTLDFKIPSYVLPGDIVEAEPRGLSKEDTDVGYYWTVSHLSNVKDTTRYLGDPESVTGKFSFEVPDTLGTLTVACVAFATGYYTSSASYYCEVVNPAFGKTLTGDEVSEDMDNIKDARDGKTYYYRKIGGQDWFVRNLSYTEVGVPYADATAMDDIFGRYYTWNEAQTVCPEGWRLPSNEDWLGLVQNAGYTGDDAMDNYLGAAGSLMVNAYFNDNRMWEYWPDVKVTNVVGFSSLPTGYAVSTSSRNDFFGGSEYAVYWTSDSMDVSGDGEEQGVYRMIFEQKPDVLLGTAHKTGFRASVRCVRDSE